MIANGFIFTLSSLLDEYMKPSKGAVDLIISLRRQRIPFVIVTNRSDRSLQEMADRMVKMGFSGIRSEHFYSTCMAAVDEILQKFPERKSAGYIGGKGLIESLRTGGFALNLEQADWLFIGTDRAASYEDYCYGLRLAAQGATIIKTDNRKVVYNTKKEPLIGSGSVVEMLSYASDAPVINMDFPSPVLLEHATAFLGLTVDRVVLVSGNLNREIRTANELGMASILVYGDTDGERNTFQETVHPTYMIEDLTGLVRN